MSSMFTDYESEVQRSQGFVVVAVEKGSDYVAQAGFGLGSLCLSFLSARCMLRCVPWMEKVSS